VELTQVIDPFLMPPPLPANSTVPNDHPNLCFGRLMAACLSALNEKHIQQGLLPSVNCCQVSRPRVVSPSCQSLDAIRQ
jgi:predicted RNase H-like nuclease